MKRKLKKVHKILLALIILLVAIRLILPYVIVRYVNKAMAENMAPYKGSIYDVDLNLYRGAYRICDMKVDLVDVNGKKPFVHAPRIELSVEWKSLLKGSLVGEIIMEQPVVNFKLAKSGSQTGKEANWVELVKDLFPVQINRFAVQNGKVNFIYTDSQSPDFNMDFSAFNLEVQNIRNVEEKNKALPSPIIATADAPGYGGAFRLNGNAMFLKDIPDFDYNAKFENANLTSVNDMFRYFTGGMDFESGKVSLYSEMVMKDGRYKGYFKPLLIDAKIFKLKEKDRSFLNDVKELVSEGVQEIFENHKKDQTATRVPIEGTVAGSTTDVWATILAAFTNAYIKAFRFELDNTIDFKSALKNKAENEKEVKEAQEKKVEKEEKEAKKKKKKAEKEKRKKEK